MVDRQIRFAFQPRSQHTHNKEIPFLQYVWFNPINNMKNSFCLKLDLFPQLLVSQVVYLAQKTILELSLVSFRLVHLCGELKCDIKFILMQTNCVCSILQYCFETFYKQCGQIIFEDGHFSFFKRSPTPIPFKQWIFFQTPGS